MNATITIEMHDLPIEVECLILRRIDAMREQVLALQAAGVCAPDSFAIKAERDPSADNLLEQQNVLH